MFKSLILCRWKLLSYGIYSTTWEYNSYSPHRGTCSHGSLSHGQYLEEDEEEEEEEEEEDGEEMEEREQEEKRRGSGEGEEKREEDDDK